MDWNTVLAAAGGAAAVSAPLGGLIHWLVARHNNKVVADDAETTFDDFAHAVADATHGKVMTTVRAELPKLIADALKLFSDANAPKVSMLSSPEPGTTVTTVTQQTTNPVVGKSAT